MKRKTRLNCWEFKKCGREPGGSRVKELGICPAATTDLHRFHGGTNAGRACWFVTGTLCTRPFQVPSADRAKACMHCDFYKQVKEEEYFRCHANGTTTETDKT